MARLRILQSTLNKLFALSGNQCAFPGCDQPVVNKHEDLIAEVCHIEAAEEGGQRYRPSQSDEERRAIENLIVLCPNHHKTTNNVEQFPVQQMQRMKAEHEMLVREAAALISPRRYDRAIGQVSGFAVSRLPHGADLLIGRDKELKRLDDAWADPGTHVVSIVAFGGVGKTALAVEWMGRLAAADWQDVEAYFDWSFYSQGTRDQAAASADMFIATALKHFGDPDPQAGSPFDRGQRLAGLVSARRAALVLDGLEPLQHGPGPVEGRFKDPALLALTKGLAQLPFNGLCVLTSREPVVDLSPLRGKTVEEWNLEHLDTEAGAKLLHHAGATRAGVAAIDPDDDELLDAAKQVKGHALTLRLLGRYLQLAHNGDVRRRDRVQFQKADAETQGGHAFRVIAAYERWLQQGQPVRSDRLQPVDSPTGPDESGHYERQLAVLRLLGLFDRPADPGCLAALRKPPVIDGLTEPLVDLDEEDWNITLTQLAELGLITPSPPHPVTPSPVDAHPLLREYFAAQLREQNPDAWRAAHRKLYEHLCETTEHRPEGIDGLQPLYQAVAHGCQAGLHEQARADVYRDRILRGTGSDGFYSTKKLGAIGADLGAVACFFERPWSRLSPGLSPADQAWLLNDAAFSLRALGRLTEAVEPMRAGLEYYERQEDWSKAAVAAGNVSELELTLGEVSAAVADGEQILTFSDRTGQFGVHTFYRTSCADALHQAGRRDESLRLFREVEAMQVENAPQYPWLYSQQGFIYCDLLLADAERAAWCRVVARNHASQLGEPTEAMRGCKQPPYDPVVYTEVAERAAQTLEWAETHLGLLAVALDHLTLGRVALYRAVLDVGQDACPTGVREHLNAAVDGLRASGQMYLLPLGLLSRAWLRFWEGDQPGARADLAEAQEVAERGPMPLHLADVHLTRARLFREPDELQKAAGLIKKHGYHRRDEELEDARGYLGIQHGGTETRRRREKGKKKKEER